MFKISRIRFITNVLVIYTLMAGTWWTFLLYKKNHEIFDIQIEKFKIEAKLNNIPESSIPETSGYKTAVDRLEKQKRMVLGEGVVLISILLAGIWWVNRIVSKEAAISKQQKNFLLSITHELKSPIASIKLILETFLKRNLDKPQTDKLSSNALRETERLHKLVDNLLLAARLESDYKPQMEEVNLSELSSEVLLGFKSTNTQVIVNEDVEPNLYLKLESQSYISILRNLLENAAKYTPTSPQISVSLKKKDKKIILKIADNGIGIKESEKGKIFDKFYRIGSEETRHTKGTGLGLYIVKQLIELHNGEVSVENNIPQGTVFVVKFHQT